MQIILKVLVFILVLAALALLFFHIAQSLSGWAVSEISPGSSICFKSSCFLVELATTPQEQQTGLMYRQSLDKDKGMLFIFSYEDIYPFWMKNTLIPLDMIWMDKSGKVVSISENVQPCKVENCPIISPAAKAIYVLEVNAGTVKDIGLKIGDEAKINTAVPVR